jgi:uncharacterized protein with FMN-binding domain
MKKSLLIIFTVAALGLVAVYAIPHNSHQNTVSTTLPTTTTTATPAASTSTTTATSSGAYKDGTYTGSDTTTMFDEIQVAVTISGGKITNVNFVKLIGESGHSDNINRQAGPLLASQTVRAQSAQIDGVSGATITTQGYIQSLQSALDQAKA